MAILTHPEYVVGGRWHLFLVYVGWVLVAWLVNLYLLGLLDKIENVGCMWIPSPICDFNIKCLIAIPHSHNQCSRIRGVYYRFTCESTKVKRQLSFRGCDQ